MSSTNRSVFSHNDFYHPFLLDQVPDGCDRALDVGCGTGLFVRRLASRCGSVEGIDRNQEVIAAARAQALGVPNVTYVQADLMNTGLRPEYYDFISCIASIHHLPFADAITKLRQALTPGGVLAVLGCHRQATPSGYLPDLIAIPANRVRIAAANRRTQADPKAPGLPPAPVMNPDLTIAEIRRQAQILLPGAVIRRRLYWRYSLTYQKRGTAVS